MWLENCTEANAAQHFTFDADAGALRPAGSPQLCADMGTAWRPCSAAPFVGMPFCDASLQLGARLDDLLGRITLQEKIQQLQANSAAPAWG